MENIAFVNGEFVDIADAKISIKDRGLLFADGIYEVSGIINGQIIDNESHMERWKRSMTSINLHMPYSVDQLIDIQYQLIKLNSFDEGTIYMHITRGDGEEREFEFPSNQKPSIVMFLQRKQLLDLDIDKLKAKVITQPDLRWKRRDIKSISLLPQVLAKQIAFENNAQEVWMYEDELITEGGASNAFIIKDKNIITRKNTNSILSGTTRKAIIKLTEREGLKFQERAFTIEEAYDATEAFYTSASVFVMPVVSIDDKIIGNGEPGPLTMKLRKTYIDFAKTF
tara:strand:+ start:6149 stop:6997 length:849 start_codon:yes stop_codon:yes gene_type:complete